MHMTDFRKMKNVNYMFCTEVRKTQMVHGISSEAEILDIFAYNVSTKDVVSSGKTSWSATGNEKYYEVTGEK